MRFLYQKYQAKKNEIIKVSIDTLTKIKFMTAHDFKLYQRGKTHRYYGGTFDVGDVLFVLPFDSVWHAVVEQGSYHNPIAINATCSLLPPDRDTLSSIASDATEAAKNAIQNAGKAIGDAVEDLGDSVEDLADAAIQKGKDFID